MRKSCVMNTLLFRGVMLLVFLLGVEVGGVAQEDNQDVTVGDVSNTNCANQARGESVMGHPTLKLTRIDSGILGELNNYQANCAFGDIKVICKENEQNLAIYVDEGTGETIATCICPINIYFTIFNALKEEYNLTVLGHDIGLVSFKEHSVVEIDLITLDQANEEGFSYPVMAQNYWAYEITNSVKPGYDLSQSLAIDNYFDKQLNCVFHNYVLPSVYNYLDVQAGLDQEGTMVINVLTDGIPDKDGKRVAHLFFDIVNVLKDKYHLLLNHTVMAGSENECTVCLYDGDFTVPNQDELSIPINDSFNYSALIAAITPLQLTGIGPNVMYYDLQGRRIAGLPKKGVYIQNGKKVVIK